MVMTVVEYKYMKVPGHSAFFSVVVFICVVMFVPVTSTADDEISIETALAAVKNKEYDKAFKQFQLLANKGEADAQHNLAMLYRLGKGVKKDLKLSAGWFRKAADQGVVDAQYYMGHIYDVGEGVSGNKKYAFVWYRKAAEKGHGLAQINLGVLYANGLGVEQDVDQAYLWFHVATAQGYKIAFENKEIIEKSLEPEVVKRLKEKGRDYFRQYVMPFQRNSRSNSRLRK
jgi:TPR repeat protein